VVTTEDAKDKASKWNYEYLETSAKDGTGITEAFELLVQKMWRQSQQKKSDTLKEDSESPKEKKETVKPKPKKQEKAAGYRKKPGKRNKYKRAKKKYDRQCVLI